MSSDTMNSYKKYLKYKKKYLSLKQYGASLHNNIDILIVCTSELGPSLYNIFDHFPSNFIQNGEINTEPIELLIKKKENKITSSEVIELEDFYDDNITYIYSLFDKNYIEFLEWIRDNYYDGIFKYDFDDDAKEYPQIHINDVPKKFINLFINDSSNNTDLSYIDNRKSLFTKVIQINPTAKIINYTTLDMYKLDPYNKSFIRDNTQVAKELSLEKINFIEHITDNFLNFIKTNSKKYDMIYFFGCTHPSFVMDTDSSYKLNLNKILKETGSIIYSDGWAFTKNRYNKNYQNKTEIFGFKECAEKISDQIDYVTKVESDIFQKVNIDNFFYYKLK